MVSDYHLFTVPEKHYAHTEFDAAPSNRITDLAVFTTEQIDTLYEALIAHIDELHSAYAGLLSHLNTVSEITTKTESFLRKCFFLQHNLAAQFEMLGMDRCARHSRNVESKLALFPPIHEQYPLNELSKEASQQMEQIWASPLMLNQLITMFELQMAKESLPLPKLVGFNVVSCS